MNDSKKHSRICSSQWFVKYISDSLNDEVRKQFKKVNLAERSINFIFKITISNEKVKNFSKELKS
jgi:hypothetical protein